LKAKDPIQPPVSTPDINVKNIADRIKPVSQSTDPMSVLAYGRSGTGKTVFAGTFPKPLLLLDIGEKGTDSIYNVPGVHVLKVESWVDFETIYWFLRAGKHEFKTVVIDTVTQLQKLAVESALEGDGKEKTSPMNKNLWGIASKMMVAWLINYRDLPVHTVFLAQDRNTVEDGAAGEDQIIQEVGPRLMPSVAGTLNAAVKVIGQTYIKEYKKTTKNGVEKIYSYRLRLGPHAYYLTKTRKIKEVTVPDSLANPTFQKLMDAMFPPLVEATPEDLEAADATVMKELKKLET
jgi:hypothetical protein